MSHHCFERRRADLVEMKSVGTNGGASRNEKTNSSSSPSLKQGLDLLPVFDAIQVVISRSPEASSHEFPAVPCVTHHTPLE
jgi:hypothetical protein